MAKEKTKDVKIEEEIIATSFFSEEPFIISS